MALLALWLVGVLYLAGRTLRHAVVTRHTVRESQPIDDPGLRRECEVLSRQLRLKRAPQLLSQASVSSPQAVGLLRSDGQDVAVLRVGEL